MAIARTRAGSEVAVPDLLACLPDRQERERIVKALLASSAPTTTTYVLQELSDRDSLARRFVDAELSDWTKFKAFVGKLQAMGGGAAEYGDNLVKAYARGIEHPFRYRPEDLNHILQVRASNSPPQEGEKQALMIVPRSDWNGAFNNLAKGVTDLRAQGYRVVLYEAATETEVVDALKSNNRYGSSDLIIVAAHGSPRAMSFGGVDPGKDYEADESKLIDLSDRTELLQEEVRMALKDGGRVVLESCSTGAPTPDGANLVRFFREIFPQAAEMSISGPVQPTMLNGLIFDSQGNFVKPDSGWVEQLHVRADDAWTLWRQA